MGGAVSTGQDHDDLVDKLKTANYIKTDTIETVYRAVDRAFYFLPECRDNAYRDLAWKKGNIHLSAPCIYAEVMESLCLEPGLSFLNLGSGTGYLSTMVGLVLGSYGVNHGVELFEDVVEYAQERLIEFKKTAPALDCFDFCEPSFIKGNSLSLNSDVRQYDRIYCGAACPENHENYMKNLLKIGGILVLPLNDKLMQITRKSQTIWDSKSVLSVSFSTLQLPQANDVTLDKTISLPDINPLTLQEICRTSIRRLLCKEAQNEHSDIAIRRRKYHRSKKRRVLPNFIIPILDSSDEEMDFGRNHISFHANLRNIGCVIGISPTIGSNRSPRLAPVHGIVPRFREEDDGYGIDVSPLHLEQPENGSPLAEEGTSNNRQEDNLDAIDEIEEDIADSPDEDEDDEVDEEDDDMNESSSNARRRMPKREKVDSGVGADFVNLGVDSDSMYMESDDSNSWSDHKMDEGRLDSENSPRSPRKSPRPEESEVTLYGDVMRQKISALSLPPTLKSFLNYYRPFQ